MPHDIRLWKVAPDVSLDEIAGSKLDSEARLEQWLEGDIGMIADDLLIIGCQVETDYKGKLDYLCMDGRGDLVVVELKRDRTPRDVTAQVLDYASWVAELARDRIIGIAEEYMGGEGSLNVAFRESFNEDLPETLNQSHRMLIVASGIDESTERILRYLSEAGIGINVSTFQHFTASDGSEFVARVFLIEPEEVSARVSAVSKRKPNITLEELRDVASGNGVGHLYDNSVLALADVLRRGTTTRHAIGFNGRLGGSIKTILSLVPRESSADDGLRFQVYSARLASYIGADIVDVLSILPSSAEEWAGPWDSEPGDEFTGHTGYFKSDAELDMFVQALKREQSQQ